MSISGISQTSPAYPSGGTARPAEKGSSVKATGGADKTGQAGKAQDDAALRKLKARDTEVRQHEMAHLAAAGGLATSGASFTYQKGADGVSYAVGGEVSIDASPGRTQEETIQRARTVRAAALAPADPSSQDRAVAAQAARMALEAAMELARQQGSGTRASGTSTAGKDRTAQVESHYGNSAAAGALDVRA